MAKKSRKKDRKSVKSLMQTDIRDLEISRKLRSLGEIRVNDWEFSEVLPAFRELANREVDVPELIRKTANYRVFEFNFPGEDRHHAKSGEVARIQTALGQAEQLVRYLMAQLTDEKEIIEIRRIEHRPKHHLLVVLASHQGASALIGHGGHTAAAVRSLIQASGERAGVVFELKIVEDKERKERKKGKKGRNPGKETSSKTGFSRRESHSSTKEVPSAQLHHSGGPGRRHGLKLHFLS